jgi:hypothetical protein
MALSKASLGRDPVLFGCGLIDDEIFAKFLKSTMSALPPKADIAERHCHVRFVPKADIKPAYCAPQHKATSFLARL